MVNVLTLAGERHVLDTGSTKDYPSSALVVPRLVSFQSADGFTIQGQLFRKADASTPQPGVIFVHGGPPRQMLLGWHYMDYYSNAYAVNQYLAAHGFTVLSVNYRLGIGYGRAFQHPAHAGPAGASEYQDVIAGARYLQQVDGVDAPHRHLGRVLRRVSHRPRAGAQLGCVQGRGGLPRDLELGSVPGEGRRAS